MEQNSIDKQPKKSKEYKGLGIAFGLFVVAFLLLVLYEVNVVAPKEFDKKIKTFNNGSALICYQMGSATLVSKQAGWSIYKERYFLKDEKLFDIKDRCFLEDQ